MKFKVIASGSKGNCTIIKSKNTIIMVDFGISLKRVKEALVDFNACFDDVKGVLITHDHGDHYRNIKQLSPTKLYSLKGNLTSLTNEIECDKKYILGDFEFTPIKTSHDATNPCGFIIKDENETLVYITDTGVIFDDYFNLIYNPDYLIIESNHDVKMLMESNRPIELKNRIRSCFGHLSNENSAQYACKIIGDKTKEVFLAHLSEECNTPKLALKTYQKILKSSGIKLFSFRLEVLSQYTPTNGGNKDEC